MRLYIGIDVGTSGCRAMAVTDTGEVYSLASVSMPAPERDGQKVEQDPHLWWQASQEVLCQLMRQIPVHSIRSIAIDGTSGTVLLADAQGLPVSPGIMYNDNRSIKEAELIKQQAPTESAAHGTASGLAKLLWLQQQPYAAKARYALHQADWIAAMLCGRWGVSDTNNCLKTGYDPQTQAWPQWLSAVGTPMDWLPEVIAPGTLIGTIKKEIAKELGLPLTVKLVAGTTDSTAAFIATGANQPAEAVTSLGSTLVLKIIAETPVFAPEFGVYSQPLGDYWLVGGGSNTGGAVLRHYFTDEQIAEMTPALEPDHCTGLDYYPLLTAGERFPVCDPHYPPRLEPKPEDDVKFLQGLLEGIASIEVTGYRLLEKLGAPYPVSVRSIGGGAKNQAWTRLRECFLQVPVTTSKHQEAAYGAALLARNGVI